MAMTRAEMAAELAVWSGGYLTTVGLTTADTTGNLKEPLDATLRALSATSGSAEVDVDVFLAVGRVMVLDRAIAHGDGILIDVAATELGTSAKLSQALDHMRASLALAKADPRVRSIVGIRTQMISGVLTMTVAADDEESAA